MSNTTGAYAVALTAQQFLIQDAGNPARGWGLFGAFTKSDANPTPLGLSFLFGIGGNSLLPNRPDDRFGLSYSRFGMSEVLKAEISPLLRDEFLIEGFYNVSITRWFRITADVQYVRPASEGFPHGLFAGLQTYIKF